MAVVSMGRLGGHEIGYGSDADVMFVHEPLPGADAAGGRAGRAGRGPRAAPAARAARGRPGARGRRRPAAGGQAGAAGADASTPTPPTTPSGRRSGRPRPCSGPRPSSGTADAVRAVRGADRPAALPRRGAHAPPTSARCAGSRPGSTTSGCRAAPTRPPTSSSAAADWPTSSGPCSCCRCSTPARSPACAPPAPCTALRAAADGGPARPRGRRDARRGVAAGQPDPQRDHAGAGQVRPTSCPATRASSAPWRACSATRAGASDELLNDYLRVTRRARSVVDRVFWD